MIPVNFSFRLATESDISTIQFLAEAIWEPTYKSILSKEQINFMFEMIYTEEALRKQMQEGQQFILLFEKEEAVGFAAFSVKVAADKIYKLNKIYLLPACQGKGLGNKLLSEVEAIVKQNGGAILDLNVNRHNKALHFYNHCGYQIHQEEDIPIGPYWMNDYVMRKTL